MSVKQLLNYIFKKYIIKKKFKEDFMKIAICDDEKTALESIVSCVEEYCIERKVDIEYVGFNDYTLLIPRIDEFDYFILDYQMPGIDGLSFAQTIREQYGEKKTIIFVTAFKEIVYDSFKVRAYRFLLKPINKNDLFEALDSYIFSDAQIKNLSLKFDGTTNIVSSDDILFIEANGRDCDVYTEDEIIFCHKNISWFDDELSSCYFFRAHRTYLVNLKKIKKFDCNYIEMKNGYKVSISSRKYKEFCKIYLEMK